MLLGCTAAPFRSVQVVRILRLGREFFRVRLNGKYPTRVSAALTTFCLIL